MGSPVQSGFKIKNASSISNLQAFVSNYSGGSASWYDVPASFDDPAASLWKRNGWETVAFQIPGSNIQRGWYLDCGGKVVEITFQGFDQDLIITPPPEPTTGFRIQNASSIADLQVFVSKYTNDNGSHAWFNAAQNFDDPRTSLWHRNGWETVAFKIPGTNVQRGWYLNCKGTILEITFQGFQRDLIIRNHSPLICESIGNVGAK